MNRPSGRYLWFAVLSAWLAAPAPARAHRLDEYLQATRLAIAVDRVQMEIDLTPGVTVAPDIFASIDTNHDGQTSGAESEAYARQVLQSVLLSVDGQPVPVTLIDVDVPRFDDMTRGVGIIRVRATADVSTRRVGRHHLSFLNTHRSDESVYLVNALVPSDSRIRITGQRRDRAQHGLTLDYMVTTAVPWARIGSLLAGASVIAALVLARRPRGTRARAQLR
jgi:nickel/cobalt transporter (NicO) family protein